MNSILIILLFFALCFGAWEMVKFVFKNMAGILFASVIFFLFILAFLTG